MDYYEDEQDDFVFEGADGSNRGDDELLGEINAYERTGRAKHFYEVEYEHALNSRGRLITKGLEDATIFAIELIRFINSNISIFEKYNMDTDEIKNEIFPFIAKMKNPKGKNPAAIITSYRIISNKRDNIKNSINANKNLLKEFDIDILDIVRYIRYWLNLQKSS